MLTTPHHPCLCHHCSQLRRDGLNPRRSLELTRTLADIEPVGDRDVGRKSLGRAYAFVAIFTQHQRQKCLLAIAACLREMREGGHNRSTLRDRTVYPSVPFSPHKSEQHHSQRSIPMFVVGVDGNRQRM